MVTTHFPKARRERFQVNKKPLFKFLLTILYNTNTLTNFVLKFFLTCHRQGDTDEVRAISVDLQEIAPIENINHIQGDITKKSTLDRILELFKGKKAQLVVCDGAPDVTGFHDIDQYIQSQLLVAALNITTFMLEEGGTFVAKIFQGNDIKFLYSQFKVFFKSVDIVKPRSSRSSSVEAFIVCRFFDPPKDYKPKHFSALEEGAIQEEEKSFQDLVGFVTAGDLSCYDNEDYKNLVDQASPTKFKPKTIEYKKRFAPEYADISSPLKSAISPDLTSPEPKSSIFGKDSFKIQVSALPDKQSPGENENEAE